MELLMNWEIGQQYLSCLTKQTYSVLIHPNLSGGLEHNVVGLTNQVYSGLFSYPVAES